MIKQLSFASIRTVCITAIVYFVVHSIKVVWTQEDNKAFLVAFVSLLGYNLTKVIIHELRKRKTRT